MTLYIEKGSKVSGNRAACIPVGTDQKDHFRTKGGDATAGHAAFFIPERAALPEEP
jgi:tryptophanyl-tRNA synthetase